ncbi:hypothetical protein CI610_01365 [invertebrate metagenome]|uniref:Uncharacterized protein n=1 Tax=invertebrate metagenome TaxID=1711999 RepID=A0A2H9T8T0_9ZZZZ
MVFVLSLILGTLFYFGCSYLSDYIIEPFLKKKDQNKK